MPATSGFLANTAHLAHATTGAAPPERGYAGVDGQGLVVTLFGVAGALFVFAAYNTLSRTATAKVRKR